MSPTEPSGAAREPALPQRMRDDLRRALRGGDRTAVAALRATLGVIANAEAPPLPPAPRLPLPPRVGRSAEVPRLVLSDADVDAIVRHEIGDREATIAVYVRHGRSAEADALAAEAEVLRAYLP